MECDTLSIVSAVNSEVGEDHPWRNLIFDCKELLQELGVSKVDHVFKEANHCADKPAKMGQGAPAGIYEANLPIAEVKEMLLLDASGVTRIRRTWKHPP